MTEPYFDIRGRTDDKIYIKRRISNLDVEIKEKFYLSNVEINSITQKFYGVKFQELLGYKSTLLNNNFCIVDYEIVFNETLAVRRGKLVSREQLDPSTIGAMKAVEYYLHFQPHQFKLVVTINSIVLEDKDDEDNDDDDTVPLSFTSENSVIKRKYNNVVQNIIKFWKPFAIRDIKLYPNWRILLFKMKDHNRLLFFRIVEKRNNICDYRKDWTIGEWVDYLKFYYPLKKCVMTQLLCTRNIIY